MTTPTGSTHAPRRVPLRAVVVLVLATLALVWSLARPEGDLQGPAPQGDFASSALPQAPPRGSGAAATPDSDLARVPESALPAQAATTLSLIRAGGPFPFEEDDGIFGNREGLLPQRSRDYYREYTVPTPGEGDRGARRIVAGRAGDLYWTDDHYASFRQVEEGR